MTAETPSSGSVLVQPHRTACEDDGDDREPDHIQRRGEPRRQPGRRGRGHAHLASDEEERERHTDGDQEREHDIGPHEAHADAPRLAHHQCRGREHEPADVDRDRAARRIGFQVG